MNDLHIISEVKALALEQKLKDKLREANNNRKSTGDQFEEEFWNGYAHGMTDALALIVATIWGANREGSN